MSPHGLRSALLLSLSIHVAPALAGCERVGRGLVDHFEGFGPSQDAGPLRIVGCKELSCDAGLPVPAFEGRELAELDPSGCAVLDAGASAETALEDGAQLLCTSRHVNLDDAAFEAGIPLRELRLEQVTLTLEASRPTTLILEEPHLDRVALTLRGPVDLVVNGPRALREVQVRGTAMPHGESSGAPSLRIAREGAEGLDVGSPDEPFAGRVRLERVAVTDAQVVAEQVSLESMTFYDGLIDAPVVSATDADLDGVELRVDDGQIAAGRMRNLQVTRCGRLALLGVESNDSSYATCEPGPLRVYSSAVFGGLFDGPIETELTSYSAVRFGAREATRLVMWTGVLERSAFCALTQPTAFVGVASCVACDPDVFAERGSLCDPEYAKAYKGNFCEAFEDVPRCTNPPNRPRPHQGRAEDDMPPPPGSASTEGP